MNDIEAKKIRIKSYEEYFKVAENEMLSKITYLLKNLDKDNVLIFKKFLNNISGGLEFDLVVINREDNLDPGVLSKFDNVKFYDNDKT